MNTEERILGILGERGGMTTFEIGKALGCRFQTRNAIVGETSHAMYRLLSKGLVWQDKTTRPLTWRLKE